MTPKPDAWVAQLLFRGSRVAERRVSTRDSLFVGEGGDLVVPGITGRQPLLHCGRLHAVPGLQGEGQPGHDTPVRLVVQAYPEVTVTVVRDAHVANPFRGELLRAPLREMAYGMGRSAGVGDAPSDAPEVAPLPEPLALVPEAAPPQPELRKASVDKAAADGGTTLGDHKVQHVYASVARALKDATIRVVSFTGPASRSGFRGTRGGRPGLAEQTAGTAFDLERLTSGSLSLRTAMTDILRNPVCERGLFD